MTFRRAFTLFLFGFFTSALFLVIATFAEARERIQVALVDTGMPDDPKLLPYVCPGGHQDFTGTGLHDRLVHSSVVLTAMKEGLSPDDFCVVILKWADESSNPRGHHRIAAAIRAATALRVKIINLSLGGFPGVEQEELAIRDALAAGIIIVTVSGNEQTNLSEICDIYPACYPIRHKNFHVVANWYGGQYDDMSSYGGPTTDRADGHVWYRGKKECGTSFAAGRVVNRLLKEIL